MPSISLIDRIHQKIYQPLTQTNKMNHLKTYQVQELNPFLEWHLHGSTDDKQEAMKWAQSLRHQLKRSVRVIDDSENIIEQYHSLR